MASLFRNRTLLDTFPNRNVIVESSAVFSSNNALLVKFIIDFGQQGRMTRNETIKVDPNDLVNVHNSLKHYEGTLLEIINMFEDLLHWFDRSSVSHFTVDMKDPKSYIYHRSFADQNPLMFHAIRHRKGLTFSMYGKGMYDLDIKVDFNHEGGYAAFCQKIEALVDHIRKHLRDLDKISVDTLLKEAKRNA